MRCLLDLSAMGLEPDGRRAHLIPYGKECTLVVDYKGIVELVMRSGIVSIIHADKVCENDLFDYDRGEIKQHKINFKKPRGEAYAYYALVRFKDGSEKSEVMNMDDIEAIRNRSQGYKSAIQYNKSHPWLSDFDEMAKKTVFRRCSKWLQLSPEIRDALESDSDQLADDARIATGRVVTENPMSIANNPMINNPSTATFPDLRRPIPDLPDPEPLPDGEPPFESPVEVSDATERNQLLGEIRDWMADMDIKTAKFAPLCRAAGLLESGVQIVDDTLPLDNLRLINDNRMAILEGTYKAS